jgi:hypothetical protein
VYRTEVFWLNCRADEKMNKAAKVNLISKTNPTLLAAEIRVNKERELLLSPYQFLARPTTFPFYLFAT